jgi:hypothetical protein
VRTTNKNILETPMHVTEATRGHITVREGDRTVTVYGEMLKWPEYQIYCGAVKAWDPPNESEPLTEQERTAILEEVCDYLRKLGRQPILLWN